MKVRAVAWNTFREAIRDKILYNLVFFALLIMGVSTYFGELTLGKRLKIIQDVSLASMSIFGLLIAIFVGIGLVYKEIQRRTIYTLLAKPISRGQFLIGKYLGLALTIILNVAVMSAVLLALLIIYADPVVNWEVGKAVFLILVELMLITAVAVFFSTFSTPTLSAMFTLGIYIVGRFSSDLVALSSRSENIVLKYLTMALHYLLPNLEKFDVKGLVVHWIPVSNAYVFQSFLYGLTYIIFLLVAAVLIFRRREFK
ncbi:ABC transporter permease [bacterium]|jgi:ABC-type transport system involved in multi-copper enzyme maturation permease subunit|nr:ABC transporter permease [bacterium]